MSRLKIRPTTIEVECYSGYKHPETPRAFTYKCKRYVVCEVERRWHEEDLAKKQRKRFFRIKTADGRLWDIAYQETSGQWFLERAVEQTKETDEKARPAER